YLSPLFHLASFGTSLPSLLFEPSAFSLRKESKPDTSPIAQLNIVPLWSSVRMSFISSYLGSTIQARQYSSIDSLTILSFSLLFILSVLFFCSPVVAVTAIFNKWLGIVPSLAIFNNCGFCTFIFIVPILSKLGMSITVYAISLISFILKISHI